MDAKLHNSYLALKNNDMTRLFACVARISPRFIKKRDIFDHALVLSFLEYGADFRQDYSIKYNKVHKLFQESCQREGLPVIERAKFKDIISQYMEIEKRDNGQYYVLGMRIKRGFTVPYSTYMAKDKRKGITSI